MAKKKKKTKRRAPNEAEAAKREEPVQVPVQDPLPGGKPLVRAISAMIAVAALLFTAGVYAFAYSGSRLVDGLSERIGEVVATEARGLARAGEIDRAIARFQEALETPFDDPRLRVIAAQDLARLAIDAQAYEVAINALIDALDRDADDGWNYNLLVKAYRGAGQEQRAMETAQAWYARGESHDDPKAKRWGAYNEGVIHREAGRHAEAYEAFLRSHMAVANGASAYQAAVAASKAGLNGKARELAAWAVEHGEGDIAKQAGELLKRL